MNAPIPNQPRWRFPLEHADSIALDDDGGAELVEGFIPKEGLIVIAGPPKGGKTFLLVDVLGHIALGRAYRGRAVMQGPVVYCGLEGRRGVKRRIAAFRKARANGESMPLYLMAESLDLSEDAAQLIADLRDQLGGQRPIGIAVDTLNRSLYGSESSDQDMSRYVRAADAIRDAFACAVFIVHHFGHAEQRPRGHSSLLGALDVLVSVKRDRKTGAIVAEVEMSKDGEAGLRLLSRLKIVDVGETKDGKPITSCVVEPLEQVDGSHLDELKAKAVNADQDRMVLQAIADDPAGTLEKWSAATDLHKSAIKRTIDRLALPASGKFVRKDAATNKWIITPAGLEALET